MTERSELLESIERHLQEQQAELTAFRIVWMAFVNRLLGANPDFAEERLNDLKTQSLTILGNMSFSTESGDATELARTQTQESIEALFHDMELALSEARTIRGESGRH